MLNRGLARGAQRGHSIRQHGKQLAKIALAMQAA
jgi:hypothetical protein